MAAKKPAIALGPVDDIVKAVVKKIVKKSGVPSRSSVKKNVRANVRRDAYNTIRKDASTKGMSDSAIMKNIAKSKPVVTRKTVSSIRATMKDAADPSPMKKIALKKQIKKSYPATKGLDKSAVKGMRKDKYQGTVRNYRERKGK